MMVIGEYFKTFMSNLTINTTITIYLTVTINSTILSINFPLTILIFNFHPITLYIYDYQPKP